ncbi:TPA: alpha-amylase, partial [Enterobacter hormaechei]|nr:alpha-amylase [Enterobacter hormaechei]
MKRTALAVLMLPAFAHADWSSPEFNAFSAEGTGVFTSQATLAKGTRPLTLSLDNACWQPTGAIKLNEMLSLKPCEGTPPQWRLFRDGVYQMRIDTRSGTPTLMLTVQSAAPQPVANVTRQCPKWDGKPLTIDVVNTFPEGTVVRDFYSKQTATVQNGKVILQPAANSNGLLLLERAETDKPAPFSWQNATVYFVLTDRFVNGDPTNDNSYGR